MTEKFKILANYIKDLSSETSDIETYLFVKENISKYNLNIDITSKALKNKLIEVNTTLKFQDKISDENNIINEKTSYFKKILKLTEVEIESHNKFLKTDLKKNFF